MLRVSTCDAVILHGHIHLVQRAKELLIQLKAMQGDAESINLTHEEMRQLIDEGTCSIEYGYFSSRQAARRATAGRALIDKLPQKEKWLIFWKETFVRLFLAAESEGEVSRSEASCKAFIPKLHLRVNAQIQTDLSGLRVDDAFAVSLAWSAPGRGSLMSWVRAWEPTRDPMTLVRKTIFNGVNAKGIDAEREAIINAHLPEYLHPSPKHLRPVVDRMSDPYRHFRLRKKSGGRGSKAPKRRYRDIYAPQPYILRTQRWIAQNILSVRQPHLSSFGFAPKSDMLDATAWHCGCTWLLKMDVQNFFESITERQAYRVFRGCGYTALLSFQLARICTRSTDQKHYFHLRETDYPHPQAVEGYLPQGAPTSPMLSNLAVFSLDQRLSKIATTLGWKYSRYADDLAFSTDRNASRAEALKLRGVVEAAMKGAGLSPNHSKTRISPPGARKVLLGVLIDRERPRLTRRFKDNIETHLYALNHKDLGIEAHRDKRGFSSTTGMRHHILGLIAFAHHVDKEYAAKLYSEFNKVGW